MEPKISHESSIYQRPESAKQALTALFDIDIEIVDSLSSLPNHLPDLPLSEGDPSPEYIHEKAGEYRDIVIQSLIGLVRVKQQLDVVMDAAKLGYIKPKSPSEKLIA